MQPDRQLMEQLHGLLRTQYAVRPRDLDRLGIPRRYLSRLAARGEAIRLGRGLYAAPDGEVSELHSLLQVAKRVPDGVVCLLSALQFHQLGTQVPREVWIAIAPKAHQPRIAAFPVRFVRFGGGAMTSGVELHNVSGVPIRVFSAAKTVADCFKYRNKIGLDVALEALREYRASPGYAADTLWKHAQTCRVAAVMRPYLEALG
jgi:predicted transcriptional regulator of viral defense system